MGLAAVIPACVQCRSGENRKMATADAFITPASTFFVALAMRTACPAMVSPETIRNPAPPPK